MISPQQPRTPFFTRAVVSGTSPVSAAAVGIPLERLQIRKTGKSRPAHRTKLWRQSFFSGLKHCGYAFNALQQQCLFRYTPIIFCRVRAFSVYRVSVLLPLIPQPLLPFVGEGEQIFLSEDKRISPFSTPPHRLDPALFRQTENDTLLILYSLESLASWHQCSPTN